LKFARYKFYNYRYSGVGYYVFSKYRIRFCNSNTVIFLQQELYFYLLYRIILGSKWLQFYNCIVYISSIALHSNQQEMCFAARFVVAVYYFNSRHFFLSEKINAQSTYYGSPNKWTRSSQDSVFKLTVLLTVHHSISV
jgi:hypothetical protein